MTDPNWAQIATAAIACLALLGAVIQIRLARAATRRNLAYEYFKRFNDPTMHRYRVCATEFLNVKGPREAAHWDQWRSRGLTQTKRLEIVLVLNFFEELAGMYNRKLVDRDVVCEAFYAYSTEEWDKAWWFIERCCRTAPRTMDQWRRMNSDFSARTKPRNRWAWSRARVSLQTRAHRDLAAELERERKRLREHEDWIDKLASAKGKTRKNMLSALSPATRPTQASPPT